MPQKLSTSKRSLTSRSVWRRWRIVALVHGHQGNNSSNLEPLQVLLFWLFQHPSSRSRQELKRQRQRKELKGPRRWQQQTYDVCRDYGGTDREQGPFPPAFPLQRIMLRFLRKKGCAGRPPADGLAPAQAATTTAPALQKNANTTDPPHSHLLMLVSSQPCRQYPRLFLPW